MRSSGPGAMMKKNGYPSENGPAQKRIFKGLKFSLKSSRIMKSALETYNQTRKSSKTSYLATRVFNRPPESQKIEKHDKIFVVILSNYQRDLHQT